MGGGPRMLRGADGDRRDVSRRKSWSRCLELPVKEAKTTCFPKLEVMNEDVKTKFENERIKKCSLNPGCWDACVDEQLVG